MALGITRGRNQRDPWPGHISLNGVIYTCAAQQEGGDLIVKPAPDATARINPISFGESSRDPLVESTGLWNDLALGLGISEQIDQPNKDNRYNFADQCDLSTGEWQLGPAITSLQIAAVDPLYGIEFAVEFLGGLYFFGGRYCFQYVSDTAQPTLVHDFGEGSRVADVAQFGNTGGSISTYLYVALGGEDSDPVWQRFDGSTWSAEPTGTIQRVQAWQVAGSRLYAASQGNRLSYLSSAKDPYTAGVAGGSPDWTHTFVGDRSGKIISLATDADGALIVFKDDGIFTLDGNSAGEQLFPFIEQSPDSSNGSVIGFFEDQIYCQYNEGFFRFNSSFEIEPIGLEKLTKNTSPIRGRVTAFTGHSTFHAYAGIRNEAGEAYLVKFGGWVTNPTISNAESQTNLHIDAWHGSISPVYTGDRITGLFKSAVGQTASQTTPRMYMLFRSGYLRWFALPPTPNPATASTTGLYPYCTSGSVYLARYRGLFRNDPKIWNSIQINGRRIDTAAGAQGSALVTIFYRTDLIPNWKALGTVELGSANVPKLSFPASLTSQWIELRVDLASTGTAAPVVTSLSLYYSQYVQPRDLFDVLIVANNHIVMRDQSVSRRLNRDVIEANLNQLKRTPGTFPAILEDGQHVQVKILTFTQTKGWNELTGTWDEVFQVRLLEVAPDYTYAVGKWSTIEALGSWTAAQAYTHKQLANL